MPATLTPSSVTPSGAVKSLSEAAVAVAAASVSAALTLNTSGSIMASARMTEITAAIILLVFLFLKFIISSSMPVKAVIY